MVGAPGTTAFTVNVRETVAAASVAAFPAWSALIEHDPAVTNVSVPPEVMVHTPVVVDVNETVRPEVEVALSVGVVPKFCEPGLLNVIVCGALGVTELEALDAGPVPFAFVAVTVNV